MAEFPCAGPIEADVHTISGIVSVRAEPTSVVRVTVEPMTSGDAAQALADATEVEMSGSQLTVRVPEAKGIGFLRRSHGLRIRISMPTDSALRVNSASADVEASGRLGSTMFTSASGDLRAAEINGDMERKSASGDTRVDAVAGSVRTDSASGDIRIDSVGGDVRVQTASGDVAIDRIAGSFKANTASGDIRVSSVHTGETSINSASGDIVIGVAQGTGVWMDVNTLSGDTRSELGSSDGPSTATTSQLRLNIRTLSGDVLIRRAAPVPAGAGDTAGPADGGLQD